MIHFVVIDGVVFFVGLPLLHQVHLHWPMQWFTKTCRPIVVPWVTPWCIKLLKRVLLVTISGWRAHTHKFFAPYHTWKLSTSDFLSQILALRQVSTQFFSNSSISFASYFKSVTLFSCKSFVTNIFVERNTKSIRASCKRRPCDRCRPWRVGATDGFRNQWKTKANRGTGLNRSKSVLQKV